MPMMGAAKMVLAEAAPKEIRKEGLSEYFLYTIEGTEDLPHGWGKRLPSFAADDVPVMNLYQYEEERYGPQVVRFLSFANDEEHGLGTEPIPGGLVKVYRPVDDAGHLGYVGAQDTKYVPKGDEVNLELGATRQVSVTPDRDGGGHRQLRVEDPRPRPRRHHHRLGRDPHGAGGGGQLPRACRCRWRCAATSPPRPGIWRRGGDAGQYERQDKDTAQFTLDLAPGEHREFRYAVVLHHGSRAL